jgi:soluble lytic murein transglycosylase-like protein
VLALAAPATASADFIHLIGAGESLTSVAATDGLSVDQLAAANGISPNSSLISGTTLAIPPQSGVVEDVSPESAATSYTPAAEAAPATSSYAPGGSYLVQPGDTLSAIAAREGMSVATLAALNGLNPNDYLLSGSVLSFSGGSGSTAAGEPTSAAGAATTQPVGEAAEGSPSGGPYPTDESVSASEVGSIAADNGVPSSLADAIGWQESGFNNAEVSSDDAIGVMQILPGTWQWINSSLTETPLSPASATSNVTGGVLMLHSLLDATGGSESMAAAGYYQGLPSVEKYGIYPSTQKYVNDVMSLASSFGG